MSMNELRSNSRLVIILLCRFELLLESGISPQRSLLLVTESNELNKFFDPAEVHKHLATLDTGSSFAHVLKNFDFLEDYEIAALDAGESAGNFTSVIRHILNTRCRLSSLS